MTPRLSTDDTSITQRQSGETEQTKRESKCECWCVRVLLKFIKLEHSFFTVDGDWSALVTATPLLFLPVQIFFRVANNRMMHSRVSHFMWYNDYYGLFIIGRSVAQIVQIGFLCQSERKNRRLQINDFCFFFSTLCVCIRVFGGDAHWIDLTYQTMNIVLMIRSIICYAQNSPPIIITSILIIIAHT